MLKTNLNEYLLNTTAKDKWKRIGARKRSGVVVPLFSIYSQKSVGIGELDDLRLLIDWCVQTGKSIIQLLPLNDTGIVFRPYDAVSSFALEPAYLSLRLMPLAKNKTIADKIENTRKAYPTGRPHVNYGIKAEKARLLWEMFLLDKENNYPEFEKFKAENAYWIDDFAMFKALKYHHEGKPWFEWEDRYKSRDVKEIEAFRKEHQEEILFHIWAQWQLYRQFKEVRQYARLKGVLIKGDLPILVARNSADVWAHQEFFKLEFAAGAPPDMYCAKGQRWGMPTYNWEKIASDGYRYLKDKFRYAQEFYDILRIDHVVGIFRIWSIPYDEPLENQGLNGFFDPQDETTWGKHGKDILSVILNSTDMLLCAEDLGVIPQVCTETLKEMGIPGNDVQRWIKEWKTKHDFLTPEEYRALSVAMLSTHDTTNWPAWWENEAGTIDETLFIRKCKERKIDYSRLKPQLFDATKSLHGRLRWLEDVDSVDKLVWVLGKKKEELKDFIDLYENNYREKEKLWIHFGLKGPMREKCDSQIMQAALKITLASSAVFCIETIIDWLYLTDLFEGDPYQYRINIPGTVSLDNWSMVIPISLDNLLKHKICAEIKSLIAGSGRI